MKPLDRLDSIFSAGLQAASEEYDRLAADVGASGISRTVERLAQLSRALEIAELEQWTPERIAPRGFLQVESAGEPYDSLLRVFETCACASVEELRPTRRRWWSDATAAPFVVAALRERPKVAVALVEPSSNPIVGRTAVQLCLAVAGSEPALRRLAAGPPPTCHRASDVLAAGTRRESRLREYGGLARTALWARHAEERAEAVAKLGQTLDPIFIDVLRTAADDRHERVRGEAEVALALVGDDSRLETWIEERRLRPLGILREARGLASLVEAALQSLSGAIAALSEAGEDGIEAVHRHLEGPERDRILTRLR